MSEAVEFVPASLDVALDLVDDTPAPPEPEVVAEVETVEETPNAEEVAEEPKPEPEIEPVKDEQATNFAQMREIVKAQKAEIEALKAPQEPVKAPDVFEDQEAYTQHLEQKFESKLLNMSEEMVKAQYDDYDKMLELVVAEAEANPSIRNNIANQPNAALAVYNEGQRLQKEAKYKDPNYEANLKAEMKLEILAELEKNATLEADTKAALRNALPDDLTSESNAGGRTTKEVFTPTSLDALLP